MNHREEKVVHGIEDTEREKHTRIPNGARRGTRARHKADERSVYVKEKHNTEKGRDENAKILMPPM